MALGKLFNLFALSSLAVLVCNLGATPVTALAHNGHQIAKVKRAHGHESVAKRRRDSGQRCKPRPSTSAPAATSAPEAASTSEAPSSSEPDTTSTPPPAATTTTPSSNGGSGGSGGSGSGGSGSGGSGSGGSGSGSGNGGSGKVGLGWPNGNEQSLRNFVTDKTQYIYTWSEQCPSLAKELGLTCMPMLWGGSQDKLDAFKNTVVAGYANIALGFNEVNEPGQANMDVDTAVSLWWQYLEPLVDQGYQLVAPVTSSNPNGLVWMKEFMSKCNGCHVNAMPIHYYGTSGQDMINYIEEWYNQFKLPIYVTEYACQNFNTANENNGAQCSPGQVWEFHKTVVDYMEGNPNVVTYCPFGFMRDMQGVNTLNQLMSGDGSPTALGSTYVHESFN